MSWTQPPSEESGNQDSSLSPAISLDLMFPTCGIRGRSSHLIIYWKVLGPGIDAKVLGEVKDFVQINTLA